jgi:glutamate-5-semialdehyde dehydrogenase
MIKEVNQQDLSNAPTNDIALLDRLKVDDRKLDEMITSLHHTSSKKDPDGKVIYEYRNKDGLLFQNVSCPFGKILIIYESRPDVTIEAAAMAFKSGNYILLKGGKEARGTNLLLTQLWKQALHGSGYDETLIQYLDFNREETQAFISQKQSGLDLIIPRGGDTLIEFVLQHASAPVIVSGRGNNFVYLHEDANLEMALAIIINGKSRISVCNALDKVLINRILSREFIHRLIDELSKNGILVLGDGTMGDFSHLLQLHEDEAIWYEEFLSSKILLSLSENADSAINTINKYSGGHSAAIITSNHPVADHFMKNVDCAAVYHNASTRFTDGGQVGFGGEMAISTQKLHFRGPVGMDQLVTNKWLVFGNGHIRN